MANLQLLKMLRKRVRDWNTWRDEHPEITPDLSEEHLVGYYPDGLYLRNLHNINFRGCVAKKRADLLR